MGGSRLDFQPLVSLGLMERLFLRDEGKMAAFRDQMPDLE